MSLSDAQLDRYARHIILKEIGGEGQRKLLAARIAVIGAGGIGSPVLQYLAAAGVGEITIIDDDDVSLPNLQRQTLFRTEDIGLPKVERAAKFMHALNPDVMVIRANKRLTVENATSLLTRAQVIIDGSDNFATRLIVSDTATALKTPLISAAVIEVQGQLAIFKGWQADQPCYRCFIGSDPDRPEQSCSEQGVLGAMAGVMGSLAAMEAIRLIIGFGDDMTGKLLRVDGLSLRFRTAKINKDPACPTCAA